MEAVRGESEDTELIYLHVTTSLNGFVFCRGVCGYLLRGGVIQRVWGYGEGAVQSATLLVMLVGGGGLA